MKLIAWVSRDGCYDGYRVGYTGSEPVIRRSRTEVSLELSRRPAVALTELRRKVTVAGKTTVVGDVGDAEGAFQQELSCPTQSSFDKILRRSRAEARSEACQ